MAVNPLGGTVAALPGMAPGAFPPPPGGFGAPPPMGAPPGYGDQGAGLPAPAPFGAAPPADGPQVGAPPVGPTFDIGAQQGMIPAGAPMGVNMVQPGYGAPGMMGGAMPGGAGAKGQTRNPVMTLLISWICFLYMLYVHFQMANELKAFLNTEEITPWWMFIFPLNLLLILKLPNLMVEAKRRAGVANPQAGGLFMYLFFTPYVMAKDLNEVWNPTGQLPA
jgi:hypothetical protein